MCPLIGVSLEDRFYYIYISNNSSHNILIILQKQPLIELVFVSSDDDTLLQIISRIIDADNIIACGTLNKHVIGFSRVIK